MDRFEIIYISKDLIKKINAKTIIKLQYIILVIFYLYAGIFLNLGLSFQLELLDNKIDLYL